MRPLPQSPLPSGSRPSSPCTASASNGVAGSCDVTLPCHSMPGCHGNVSLEGKETDNKGSTAGAEKFIDCLLRSDKKEWPKLFSLALEREDCTQILELWYPRRDCETEPRESAEEIEEDTSAFNVIQYSEEPEQKINCLLASVRLDNHVMSGLPKMESNRSASVPEMKLRLYQEELAQPAYRGKNTIICAPTGNRSASVPEMKLRLYQEELAQPAYRGKNTIICAPTGSGKTIVALAICVQHLKSVPKGKVVFIVTQLPVYEKKKDVFIKYFESSGYKVAGVSGESGDHVNGGLIVKKNDIIVLTPQILVNCLETRCVPSISIFTLMIFNECHNTTGNHPYNVLMFNYLNLKLNSDGQRLPQIIGLTASVATGKTKYMEDPMIYISKLCASLDTEVISTVKEHVEELEKVISRPQKFTRETGHRETDPFAEILSVIMMETEQMAKKVYPALDSMSNIQNRSSGTQKYEQWIIETQKKCQILQMENKQEEMRICRALFTFTEHLRKYNDSLMINDDARTKDALEYLQNFFHNVKNGTYDHIEEQLTKNFEAIQPELLRISNDNLNENPKLDELKFLLGEVYHESPQTHTLLFVKTRALVLALKRWIEETPALSFLKPDMLIGRNRRHDSSGMTFSSQKGVLDASKSPEESKMLIATSVADEGIDIPECNLVLLYEYVGSVTKMIQVRGRGRAKDCKCFLVTSKPEEAEKERINILQEQVMNDAVTQLQKLEGEEFLNKIRKLQNEEKNIRDLKNVERPKLTEGNKKLYCGKCKVFVCNTDDIRIIQATPGNHHTVVDRSFKERYITVLLSKPKSFQGFTKEYSIYCKEPSCKKLWGDACSYLKRQNIPLLKIKSFVVENAEETSQESFRKWADVNFTMKELSQKEISESFSANTE
ncbi:hypothetical protein FKM82_000481 [Ascaphus truei]